MATAAIRVSGVGAHLACAGAHTCAHTCTHTCPFPRLCCLRPKPLARSSRLLQRLSSCWAGPCFQGSGAPVSPSPPEFDVGCLLRRPQKGRGNRLVGVCGDSMLFSHACVVCFSPARCWLACRPSRRRSGAGRPGPGRGIREPRGPPPASAQRQVRAPACRPQVTGRSSSGSRA